MSIKRLAALVLAVTAAIFLCTDSFLSADRVVHAQTRLPGGECCNAAGGAEDGAADGVVAPDPARAPCEVAVRPLRSPPAGRRRDSVGRGTWTVPARTGTAESRDS